VALVHTVRVVDTGTTVLAVTSPDERARDRDRDAAIKTVEDAFKSGRIIQADRDKRVDELRSAQTMQDVDILVRDLRPHPTSPAPQTPVPTVSAGQTPTQPGQQPWPLVNYGPAEGSTVEITQLVGKTGRTIGGVIAAVVLLSVVIPIAGVIIFLVSARDSFPDSFGAPTDETTYLPGVEPGEGGINVHTVKGYQDLVAAVEEETGSTEVFDVSLYPRYAVVHVPITDGSPRYQTFYWDGELSDSNSKGTNSYEPIDLEDVRPELVIRLLKKVRGLVDSPDNWYASASAASGEGQVSAYASNEFSESAFVQATFDGEITYDSTQP